MTGQSIRWRAPLASSPKVRKVMVANYGGNTTPERLLRSALFRLGLRFRRDTRPVSSLRCMADIVFRGAGSSPGSESARGPRANRADEEAFLLALDGPNSLLPTPPPPPPPQP